MKYILIITVLSGCVFADITGLSSGYEYPQPELQESYLPPEQAPHEPFEHHQQYAPAEFEQEQAVASYIPPSDAHFENSQEYQPANLHHEALSQPLSSYIPSEHHHHHGLQEYQTSLQQQHGLEQQLTSYISAGEHHEYQQHIPEPAPVQEFHPKPARSYTSLGRRHAAHHFDSFEPAHHDGYHYKTFRRVIRRHRH